MSLYHYFKPSCALVIYKRLYLSPYFLWQLNISGFVTDRSHVTHKFTVVEKVSDLTIIMATFTVQTWGQMHALVYLKYKYKYLSPCKIQIQIQILVFACVVEIQIHVHLQFLYLKYKYKYVFTFNNFMFNHSHYIYFHS